MRSRRLWAIVTGFVIVAGLLTATVDWRRGERVDVLVLGGTVVTLDGSATVIPDGAVAVRETAIVAVGPREDLEGRFAPARTVDARGQIVLPGLINTHGHAPMVLYRGLADDLALMAWLNNYIFPAEAATVSPDFVRVGTRLAALEMIGSGTTTFADMYYFEEDIAEVTREAGLRAVLGQSVIQFPVADAPTPQDALARAEQFILRWKHDPLITPAVAPHSPYTLDAGTLKAARALANAHDVPLLIHLAETREEVRIIRDAHRTTPAQYLESLGVWSGRSLAAHAVWLDAADMQVLQARGVGLAHNPESNMKLSSGVAAVPEWLRRGIRAGLGTDGAASNNDLDMFEAMRVAALLQKLATGDPTSLPARQALELATRRGAEALGMGDRIGSLEAGKQADLITVDVSGARQTPLFDPISHLVYVARGADVRTAMVAGRVLMEDRRVRTINAPEALADARAMAERVSAAVAAKAAKGTDNGR
jgi:5-methylthioadenosine/S-adenosylhomocysteine deaminase